MSKQTQLLMLAKHIASAASFFDMSSCTAPADQEESRWHVQHLHDAAQILAGDQGVEIYTQDDGHFEIGAHHRTGIQCDIFDNTPLVLDHWREEDGRVRIAIALDISSFRLQLSPTPTQCRELAAALKQLADDAEASAAQHTDTISLSQTAGQCVACEAA